MKIRLNFLLGALRAQLKKQLARLVLEEHLPALGRAVQAELPQLSRDQAEAAAEAVVRRLIERVL